MSTCKKFGGASSTLYHMGPGNQVFDDRLKKSTPTSHLYPVSGLETNRCKRQEEKPPQTSLYGAAQCCARAIHRRSFGEPLPSQFLSRANSHATLPYNIWFKPRAASILAPVILGQTNVKNYDRIWRGSSQFPLRLELSSPRNTPLQRVISQFLHGDTHEQSWCPYNPAHPSTPCRWLIRVL